MERRAEAGSRPARLTLGLLRRLSFNLSGAQFGITVSSLLLGFIAEPAIGDLMEPLLGGLGGASAGVSVGLALAIATVVQMVLGELIPKSLAIARPLPTALGLAAPMRAYGAVFGVAINALNRAADAAVRRLGVEPTEEISPVHSLAELDLLFAVAAEEGTLDTKASRLLRRSVRFGEKTAADVLVPRTALVAVPGDATAHDVVNLARRTGHSRFPVYGSDLDDIAGMVHVKQVHQIPPEKRSSTLVQSFMSEVMAVPETRDLDDLLIDIQRSRSHLAVVVDEFGGTAGIVTLEDLLEEIVGPIADEYDEAFDVIVPEQPGEWLLSGGLHPDEVFDACGLELPAGDYETLAGFVLDRLGFVPSAPGATFSHDGWVLAVEEMDRLRVATVRVRAPGHGEGAIER